jgi:hypothetical protein
MKTIKKFLILFMAIFAVLANSNGFGQCVPAFTSVVVASTSAAVTINPASGGELPYVCVNIAASGSTEYIATVTHSSCPQETGTTYSISLQGGIELVGSAPNPNTNIISGAVYTSKVRFRSKDDIYCKGRINFKVTYPASTKTCTTGVAPNQTIVTLTSPGGSFTTSIDVYKTITSYPVIAGPSCITNGKIVWSVNPKLQCPSDGIGVDKIVWNYSAVTTAGATLEYTSLDNPSAVTFNFTSAFNPSAGAGMYATVGKCPGFTLPTISIYRSASGAWITSNSGRVVNYGASTPPYFTNTVPAGSVTCGTTFAINGSESNGVVLPINTNATDPQRITLFADGNGPELPDQGIKFSWSPGSDDGFIVNQGTSTNPFQSPNIVCTTAVFTQTNLATGAITGNFNNATGTFSVLASSPNGCTGATGANYDIYRYLVAPASDPGYTQATTAKRYNYIINSSGQAPKSCYKANDPAETIILQNAPTGPLATFHWLAPSGWILQAAPNSGASAIVGAGTNEMTGLNLVSVTIAPAIGATSGEKVKVNIVLPTYPNGTTWCSVPNTLIEYPYTGTLTVEGNKNLTLTANPPTGSPKLTAATVTFPTSGVTPACGYDQLEAQFEFNGTVTNTATGAFIYATSGWECGSQIFTGGGASCGTNWISGFPSGSINTSFITGRSYAGKYRTWVRVRGGITACSSLTCYNSSEWKYYPSPTANGNWRMAAEATWDGGSEVSDPLTGLVLYPNPAEQEFHLVLPEGEKGSFEICDLNGKRVLKGAILGGDQVISTKGVPKGMYLVKTKGNSTSVRKIVIQ